MLFFVVQHKNFQTHPLNIVFGTTNPYLLTKTFPMVVNDPLDRHQLDRLVLDRFVPGLCVGNVRSNTPTVDRPSLDALLSTSSICKSPIPTLSRARDLFFQ